MAKYKVVSTKKLLPSLVEQAKDNDIDITEQEFIFVHPIVTEEKTKEVADWVEARKEFALFTSENAVTALAKQFDQLTIDVFPKWKVFCLSGKTKEAVGRILNAEIIDTAENAGELAQKIISRNIKEVVFFCGNKRRDELPEVLCKNKVKVHEVIVYETVEMPSAISGSMDAILFFSPSAVHSFFSVNQLSADTVCFAIGKTTAAAIAGSTTNKIIISEGPSQERMLSALVNYFKNINCFK